MDVARAALVMLPLCSGLLCAMCTVHCEVNFVQCILCSAVQCSAVCKLLFLVCSLHCVQRIVYCILASCNTLHCMSVYLFVCVSAPSGAFFFSHC